MTELLIGSAMMPVIVAGAREEKRDGGLEIDKEQTLDRKLRGTLLTGPGCLRGGSAMGTCENGDLG